MDAGITEAIFSQGGDAMVRHERHVHEEGSQKTGKDVTPLQLESNSKTLSTYRSLCFT